MVSTRKIEDNIEGIICPECQRLNSKDARFCINCGGKLKVHCPNCGLKTPPGKFCIFCGVN